MPTCVQTLLALDKAFVRANININYEYGLHSCAHNLCACGWIGLIML